MSLVNYLEDQLARNGLSEEFYVKNSKGLIESLLDDMLVVDLQKVVIKKRNSGFLRDKTVCVIEIFHNIIKKFEIKDVKLSFLKQRMMT